MDDAVLFELERRAHDALPSPTEVRNFHSGQYECWPEPAKASVLELVEEVRRLRQVGDDLSAIIAHQERAAAAAAQDLIRIAEAHRAAGDTIEVLLERMKTRLTSGP